MTKLTENPGQAEPQAGDRIPILETQALTRRFGKMTAVDGLTLSVKAGEVFGLLGPNGAGKSTAIKMLTTLLPISSGRATIAEFDNSSGGSGEASHRLCASSALS